MRETGESRGYEHTYSIDEMTFLFRNMTRFCTSVFLVSGASKPYDSSNIAESWDGNSAVSLG